MDLRRLWRLTEERERRLRRHEKVFCSNLLSNHEMAGEYLGPLKKMLEGKLDFEKGK